MRDRAFAERSAERRALAVAIALEAISDETSLTDMTCEDVVKYKTCTEALNITVGDSVVDVVTEMACADHKKCEDPEKYEKFTEADDTTVNESVTEQDEDMASEDLERCDNCTEALDTMINDSVACLPGTGGPDDDMGNVFEEKAVNEQMPDFVQQLVDELTETNPNLAVTYIWKKAPKIRRLPQRSRQKYIGKQVDTRHGGRNEYWRDVDKQLRAGARAAFMEVIKSEVDDDVANAPAKHVGKQGGTRRGGWDADWHDVDEQLRAGTGAISMAVIKSELVRREAEFCIFDSPCWSAGGHRVCAQAQSFKSSVKAKARKSKTHCGNAGQLFECAQAQSFKLSVEARASKLKKTLVNMQKQERRRFKRRQARAAQYEKNKDKCCLIDALCGLGFRVHYKQDGPFWVLKDGSEMVRPFGYSIGPEARLCTISPGKWLICKDGHCIGLHRKGEGNTRIIDGQLRERIADRDLDTLVKGADIYRVPTVDVAYYLEFVIPSAVGVCLFLCKVRVSKSEMVIPIVVCVCQMFSL